MDDLYKAIRELIPIQRSEDNWTYDFSMSYKGLFQPEAMCLSMDKKYYFVTSERKPYLLKIKAK